MSRRMFYSEQIAESVYILHAREVRAPLWRHVVNLECDIIHEYFLYYPE